MNSWRRRIRTRLWSLLGPLVLVLATNATAQDQPEQRQALFGWDDRQVLRMTIGFRDIVDDAVRANLTGGLPTTIVAQAYLLREAGGEPIAAAFRACRVTFDLWDEVYRIELAQSGASDSVAASPTLEGVLRRCAEVERLALAHKSVLLGKGRLYVALLVEVNPVSQEMLERIRRWVSRSTAGGVSAPGDALFGSFVGLFVTRIGTADRQLRLRTQVMVP